MSRPYDREYRTDAIPWARDFDEDGRMLARVRAAVASIIENCRPGVAQVAIQLLEPDRALQFLLMEDDHLPLRALMDAVEREGLTIIQTRTATGPEYRWNAWGEWQTL